MDDGRGLVRLEHAAAEQLQQNRRTRAFVITNEGCLLRQCQVHARLPNRADRSDGARQFGLQGMLVACTFHELADAKTRLLLHQVHARRNALRQAHRRELQSRIVQLRLRNHHAAIADHLVVNIGSL